MTDTALLRALLADATERPWHTGSEIDPKQVYVYFPPHFIPITLADSVLIVEAVNSLPDLLDELGRLRTALQAIAEDDDLVKASGGAWGQQAYERRRDIARAALSPETR